MTVLKKFKVEDVGVPTEVAVRREGLNILLSLPEYRELLLLPICERADILVQK